MSRVAPSFFWSDKLRVFPVPTDGGIRAQSLHNYHHIQSWLQGLPLCPKEQWPEFFNIDYFFLRRLAKCTRSNAYISTLWPRGVLHHHFRVCCNANATQSTFLSGSNVAHHPSSLDGYAGTGSAVSTERMFNSCTRHFWSATKLGSINFSFTIHISIFTWRQMECGLHSSVTLNGIRQQEGSCFASRHNWQHEGTRGDVVITATDSSISVPPPLLSLACTSVDFLDFYFDFPSFVALHNHFYSGLRNNSTFASARYIVASSCRALTRGTIIDV